MKPAATRPLSLLRGSTIDETFSRVPYLCTKILLEAQLSF